jgi:hypothetical protein
VNPSQTLRRSRKEKQQWIFRGCASDLFFLERPENTKLQTIFKPTSNLENAILKPLERGPSNDLRRGETEIPNTTFSDGCLGSHIDEERSEMRYVMRIAESSESSKF